MTKETNVWIVCEGLPTYTRLAAARRATLTTCRAGVLRKKKRGKKKEIFFCASRLWMQGD